MPILVKRRPFLSWDLESQHFMAERPPHQLSVAFGFILYSSCKSSLLGLFILLTLLISSALSSHLKAFGWSPGTCGVYTRDKIETHSGTGCWEGLLNGKEKGNPCQFWGHRPTVLTSSYSQSQLPCVCPRPRISKADPCFLLPYWTAMILKCQ